ncbi:hypothetical protein [Vogesella mureinivorans]|uniref:hypothetical protein n=1 Tax=Vogesella mureinivorans TaxID=657276 RepID=UPI0011CB550D|nr:hypothetical protein [Vogesella mureinivorans]
MVDFYNKIRSNSVDFYRNGTLNGRGVILESNGSFYVITAGHVVYGHNFELIDGGEFLIKLECGVQCKLVCILTDCAFSKENELCILKVELEGGLEANLKKIELCRIVKNPEITSCSVIRPAIFQNENSYPVTNLTYREQVVSNALHDFNVEPNHLQSVQQGSGGSYLLAGISGSGLFVDAEPSEGNLYLHGILCEVPHDGISATFRYSELDKIADIDSEDITLIEKNFDLSSAIKSRQMLKILRVEQNAINDWSANAENKIFFDNITRKMKVIYPAVSDALSERSKIIRLIIAGDSYIQNYIRKNQDLSSEYDYLMTAREGPKIYLNTSSNIAQAHEKYQEIQDECLQEVEESFSNKLPLVEKKVIRNYIISTQLADCNLDIKGNSDDCI